MKKILTIGIIALLGVAATGCGGTNQEATDTSATSDKSITKTADPDSFESFLIGSWKCTGKTQFVEADFDFPQLGWRIPLQDVTMEIGEGTLVITDDRETYSASWDIDGSTMTIVNEGLVVDPGPSPTAAYTKGPEDPNIGKTQTITNVPETVTYASEPVDMKIATDSGDTQDLRVQVHGQRQMSFVDTYQSNCLKS